MSEIIKKHFTIGNFFKSLGKIWNFIIFKKLWFDGSDFSVRKFLASIFAVFAVYEKYEAIFNPLNHFSVQLTEAGVDNTVIITIIASLDALSLGALAIYGWSNGGKQANNGTDAATTASSEPVRAA